MNVCQTTVDVTTKQRTVQILSDHVYATVDRDITPKSMIHFATEPKKQNLDDTIEYKSMDPELISYIQEAIKESSQSLLPDLFKNSLQQFTSEIATLREEVNRSKTDIAELQEQVDTLTTKGNNMETKYDDLDQEARSSSIILLNQWEEQPAELPMTMAKNYIQEALNIDIHDNDIVKCFRLGRKSRFERNGKPRPILIKFATVSLKTAVLLARRRTRKFVSDRYQRPVFINEDLTPTRQEIFTKCRQLKKAGKIKDCWSQNGRIMVRALDDHVTSAKWNELSEIE